MAHELNRILLDIRNKPQLCTQEYLEYATDFLEKRSANPEMALHGGRKREKKELLYNEDTKVGIISAEGPLTYQEINGLCGETGCSYHGILSQAEAMISAGAKTIVMDCDSPGGVAYGVFESANELRKMADDNGVKLIAYVDGVCASACYGLAVACHEIIANPMAEVGSIGVVVQLVNTGELEKNMGVKRSYVFAGESKVPFDNDGNFTAEFLADIQDKVNTLYTEFVGHVAEYRNLEKEAVVETKAKVFLAEKAKKLGLVDAVMTRMDFSEYLGSVVESGNKMSLKKYLSFTDAKMSNEMIDVEMKAALDAANTSLAEMTTNFEAKAAELASVVSALEAATGEIASLKASLQAEEENKAKAKTTARLTSLKNVVGDEMAASLSAAYADMEDSVFEMTLNAMKAGMKKESESEHFTETGVSGEGDVKELSKLAGTKAILAKQYNK